MKWEVKELSYQTILYCYSAPLNTQVPFTLCKDFRPLDFRNLMNLFLKRVDKVRDFNLYVYRWDHNKAQSEWKQKAHLRAFLNSIVSIFNKYPRIDFEITIFIHSKRIAIAMPEKKYLDLFDGEALIAELVSVGQK